MAKTALITGASEGIGYELVKLFAKDGYDCVLVARNKEKMDQLAGEVEKLYGIKTRVIAKDLSLPEAAQEIFDELKGAAVPVDVLVNNAGLGLYGDFAESDMDMNMHLIQVNLVSLTKLTWLFVPGMIARKSGKIMTVGSIASFAPSPRFCLYNASKAYVLYFSEALGEELKGTGVTVTCLCPGATRTQWHTRANSENIRLHQFSRMIDAKTVAELGYQALLRGKRLAIPGCDNNIAALFSKFAPRAVVLKFARFLTGKSSCSSPCCCSRY
ncbi:MAG: short-chain dehydrogenase [Desulfobacterium sp.]|nr:short-chain dehydrogenase [Desulfobacterium sp.]